MISDCFGKRKENSSFSNYFKKTVSLFLVDYEGLKFLSNDKDCLRGFVKKEIVLKFYISVNKMQCLE